MKYRIYVGESIINLLTDKILICHCYEGPRIVWNYALKPNDYLIKMKPYKNRFKGNQVIIGEIKYNGSLNNVAVINLTKLLRYKHNV